MSHRDIVLSQNKLSIFHVYAHLYSDTHKFHRGKPGARSHCTCGMGTLPRYGERRMPLVRSEMELVWRITTLSMRKVGRVKELTRKRGGNGPDTGGGSWIQGVSHIGHEGLGFYARLLKGDELVVEGTARGDPGHSSRRGPREDISLLRMLLLQG